MTLNAVAAETIKDPIFQLAAVVFLCASAIALWMILSAFRRSAHAKSADTAPREKSGDTLINLGADAKFQLLLENVIAINKRLDELDARLKAGGVSGVSSERGDIAAKLDAMYKILAGLSGSESK